MSKIMYGELLLIQIVNDRFTFCLIQKNKQFQSKSFQSKSFGHRLINYLKRTFALYSGRSLNGHSRKQRALRTATFTNSIFSTPTQILNLYILVSGELQVWTSFSRSEDVYLWKRPLYPSPSLNSITERFCKELSYLSENPNIAIPEDNQTSCYNL